MAKALRLGCRVIELDCWDAKDLRGRVKKVIVTHGGTLTSRTSLKRFARAVRDNAFIASDLPVILTLENHCSAEGQKLIAHTLHAVLAGLLHVPDGDAKKSPAQLRRKVLIRDKIREEEEDVEDPVPALNRLVSIRNVKTKDLTVAPVVEEGVPSSSWSETKFNKVDSHDMMVWCRTALARIYPAGLRIDSSNYDPSKAWTAGCQIVALNMQAKEPSKARPVWLNQGKFLFSPYILKPDWMLADTSPWDPSVKTVLRITLNGARGWTGGWGYEKLPDIYCNVVVHGGPDKHRHKTDTVMNTTEPSWTNNVFDCPLTAPELAVCTIEFWDDDAVSADDFMGQVSVPVTAVAKDTMLTLPLLSLSHCLWEHGGSPTCDVQFQFIDAAQPEDVRADLA